MNKKPLITISIVSHNHIGMICDLISDIEKHCSSNIEIILTINVPEPLPSIVKAFTTDIKYIHNDQPLGFAENHNNAFKLSKGAFFCVLNPDVRLTKDPFPALSACLGKRHTGVVAPLVINNQGVKEVTARKFPTPFSIFLKSLRFAFEINYSDSCENEPDWVGGMFMLFPIEIFREINGFDQKYFLYYEDVDICARLMLKGYQVEICHEATVVHDARKDSHLNLRFLKWHIASMFKFFTSKVMMFIMLKKVGINRVGHIK